jgi:hypothetical protein
VNKGNTNTNHEHTFSGGPSSTGSGIIPLLELRNDCNDSSQQEKVEGTQVRTAWNASKLLGR